MHILESKGLRAIFRKKGKKKGKENVKKGQLGQNIWKFGPTCTKFENILKKGKWLRAIIAIIARIDPAIGSWIAVMRNGSLSE